MGMFDEMGFLFESYSNLMNIYKEQGSGLRKRNIQKIVKNSDNEDELTTQPVSLSDEDVGNYISSGVNIIYNQKDVNPYSALIKLFENTSMELKTTDFVYLRDIGVMPINRLFILRRYSETSVVNLDLNKQGTKPISTIVGWIKPDQESKLFSLSFNEVWEPHTKQLHELIAEIVDTEFGPKLTAITPIPGWGAGIMFNFLKEMGLVDKNAKLPLGDPNVLRESHTRAVDKQGLVSRFTFTLNTVYEQKQIGDVDMTVATMDILNNLLKMGTSDIRFIGNPGSSILQKLRKANNDPTNPTGWLDLIKDVMIKLQASLQKQLDKVKETIMKKTSDAPKQTPQVEADAKQNEFGQLFNKIISDVLQGTVGKYVWKIRGSVSMLTGEAVTPWHLTIGNPTAPVLSLNNILVSSVDVSLKGEMQYNDIPKYLEVSITTSLARNMGKNEIIKCIGIGYERKYEQKNK